MKRRTFLHQSMAATAALSCLPSRLLSAPAGSDPLHEIGLITNVVQKMIAENPEATLSMIADLGYRKLEFGGDFGLGKEKLKSLLGELGIRPVAGGTNLAGMQGDGLKQLMDDCLYMGKEYVVCYWPWMDGGENPTLEKVRYAVDQLQDMGEQCRKAGLRLAFHNHWHEFVVDEGQVLYDYILEQTDPDTVCMEVDLYWAYKGKADIRDYFKKHPGRFELVHLKDSYDKEGMETFAPVGDGVIDFPDLLSYREVAGFRHPIVEHDRPEDEAYCACRSMEYLKSIDY
ncbi:MAG: sugar phosphate isomerase/epimerase [Bacteroidales bacterium]